MSDSGSESPEFTHDEEAFRRKIPYPLITTSIKGVYITPPPPDDFDISKASSRDLIRHGLLWPGPVSDDPMVLEAWRRFFSQKWRSENRIIPEFGPPLTKRTHGLGPRRKVGDNSYLGGIWAGVGIDHGTWNGNAGSWTVPTVSKPSEPAGKLPDGSSGWNSSSWVGIDGYAININSNDVLQAGVDQQVDAHGNATYTAWYEWWVPFGPPPQYVSPIPITNLPVSPGQSMFCMVYYLAGHAGGYIFLGNNTTGKHAPPITLTPPPKATFAGNTIEWIMESNDGGEPPKGTNSIPKFTPVTFSFARGWGVQFGPVFSEVFYGYPIVGDTLNIEGYGKVLTSVPSVDIMGLTIDFIG